jgi:hypothetical protein
MKKFLKQFFCIHLYRREKEEFLEVSREGEFEFGYDTYHNYAIYKKCVKCEKQKIVREKRLVM